MTTATKNPLTTATDAELEQIVSDLAQDDSVTGVVARNAATAELKSRRKKKAAGKSRLGGIDERDMTSETFKTHPYRVGRQLSSGGEKSRYYASFEDAKGGVEAAMDLGAYRAVLYEYVGTRWREIKDDVSLRLIAPDKRALIILDEQITEADRVKAQRMADAVRSQYEAAKEIVDELAKDYKKALVLKRRSGATKEEQAAALDHFGGDYYSWVLDDDRRAEEAQAERDLLTNVRDMLAEFGGE